MVVILGFVSPIVAGLMFPPSSRLQLPKSHRVPFSFTLSSQASDAADDFAEGTTISSNGSGLLSEIAPVDSIVMDPTNKLPLWKRRLITQEDPFSLHKTSAIMHAASGAAILLTGFSRYLDSQEAFGIMPDSMLPMCWIYIVSTAIMCVQSVRMTLSHRRYDIIARNAFLGTAASTLFSSFFFLWTSPFAPSAFDDPIVNRVTFAVLGLLNVYFILDTVLQTDDVVESRRDRKAEDYTGREILDAVGYVLPIAWGLLPVVLTGINVSVLHDREWFLGQCEIISQSEGMGFQAHVSYQQVAASMAASFGSLFVTLRDKKLISKNAEIIGISLFSVPTMIDVIYISYLFFHYM